MRPRSCEIEDRGAESVAALSRVTWPTLLGSSPAIRAVVQHIEKIARSDAPILIQGETGSGKELAARAIRHESPRRAGAFVAVNCGALPDGLIETELFGHGQGAFTDAKQARAGVIAQAQGGTLFFDEVDTLSPKAQVTLLRYLQDLRYRPVGVSHEVASDVRVIAASNQPLNRLVEEGAFRRDLLYRLNIFEVTIPPLRGRHEDIEVLARHFIRVFSAKYGIAPKKLHPDTLAWLQQQHWPGNVRELENWIHRELLLADGDEIRLSPNQPLAGTTPIADDHAGARTADFRTAKALALAEFERAYATRVLSEARGNVTTAAKIAGKERRAFGKLLKKHRIDRMQYFCCWWVYYCCQFG
jgi:two-component system, NtrC family, response regulator GlrR